MSFIAALSHIAGLGQLVEIGQGHAHQKETVRWARKNYMLDAQALKIDLLRAARQDVRSTFDTYSERVGNLLLLNALLLTFGLSTLQISTQFIPGLSCPSNAVSAKLDPEDYCIELRHKWLLTIWVYLTGYNIFAPFWSILILLCSKKQLDRWLERTLEALQQTRKMIINDGANISTWTAEQEDELSNEQKRAVAQLGAFIVEEQDMFMDLWLSEVAPQVSLATYILWSSATAGVVLTLYMCAMYFYDNPIGDRKESSFFSVLSVIGLAIPVVALVLKDWICECQLPGLRPQYVDHGHSNGHSLDHGISLPIQ